MMSHQEKLKGKEAEEAKGEKPSWAEGKGELLRHGRDRASWRTMNAGAFQQGTKTESDSAPSASFNRPPLFPTENVSFVVVVLVLSS